MFNNLNKNFNFIKEISIIKLKSINEYRSNLYLNLLANLGYTITLFATYFILQSNFENIFYWNIYEFVFFFLFLEIFLFIFVPWFRYLYKYLLSGDFNQFLIKPINPFLNYAFTANKFFDMLAAILYVFYIIIFMIFFIPEFYPLKFIIVVLFGIIGGSMYASINCLFDSLGFFMKNNRQLKSTYFSSTNFFSSYPSSFFKNSNLYYIIIFMANTYYASWTTDYYFNYISLSEFLILFIPCFLIITICIISSYFLWKFGLKKYEGYN